MHDLSKKNKAEDEKQLFPLANLRCQRKASESEELLLYAPLFKFDF